MKAKELRIGNYIYEPESSEPVPFKVWGAYQEKGNDKVNGYPIALFQPIPLTEEWLTKFGFLKNYSNSYTSYKLSSRGFTIEYDFRNGENVINAAMLECVGLDIDYVHQLQNLFFALTGEELTT